jgi:hypothetical protein
MVVKPIARTPKKPRELGDAARTNATDCIHNFITTGSGNRQQLPRIASHVHGVGFARQPEDLGDKAFVCSVIVSLQRK